MALNQVDISMMQDIPAPGVAGKIIISDGTDWTSGVNSPVGSIIKQATDPTVSDPATPTVGDMILNQVTGELFTCTTVSVGANVWTNTRGPAVPAADLTPAYQAIATLGLHMGVADNKVAFNLPNSFIDVFQDDAGIATETDVDRNAAEYVTSATAGSGLATPANTKMLFHMDAVDGSTTWTDSSASPHTIINTNSAPQTTTAGNYKFGASAGNFTGSWKISTADTADTAFGTGEFYVGMWVKVNVLSNAQTPIFGNRNSGSGDNTWWYLYSHPDGRIRFDTSAVMLVQTSTGALTQGTWTHVAVSRNSANLIQIFVNGVVQGSGTSTNNFSSSGGLYLGHDFPWNGYYDGWYDEFIMIKGSGGHVVAFTPQTEAYGAGLVTSATGTLVSTAQTVASTTEVSGAFLYTDNAGTNTLGTDLKIYFTANNGGAWTEASSYGTAQTFSGSIKQVKLGKTTVTAGTQVALKAVWANQAATVAGSKYAVTSGMLSHTNMSGWYAGTEPVDGALTNNTGFYVATAATTGEVRVDLGSGNAQTFGKLRVYVTVATSAAVWTVAYSDDNSSWTNTDLTTFAPGASSFGAWFEGTWTSAGAHRYWKMFISSGTGAGQGWNSEIEFHTAAVGGKVAHLEGWAVNY